MSVKPNPEAIQQIFQLMTGHIVASAVNIAAQLGIADRLANGPRYSVSPGVRIQVTIRSNRPTRTITAPN